LLLVTEQPAVQRFDGATGVPTDWPSSVVTIGVFDGVHRGHRAIVAAARAVADRRSLPVVAITFDPHPSEVVRPGTHPAMLSTVDHRVSLLGAAGADAVLVLPFTWELSQLTPDEFVDRVVSGSLHAVAVVVGGNFRFGHRALGNVDTLRTLGSKHGFEVAAVELVGRGDVTWSSTYVRQCVLEGDVAEAGEILGRPHRLEGVVVHGDHRGRELGYPTANLDLAPHAAVPADGVYAGWLVRAGTRLPAAVSIGTNPTFDGADRRVEAYVLDRDDLDLYGESVALDFHSRLRPTIRFDGVQPLLDQMAADVAETRVRVAPVG
jgi:riboflavin kinase/FMN adenylyltransferase